MNDLSGNQPMISLLAYESSPLFFAIKFIQ